MESTLYIIVSFCCYIFDVYPSYRHTQEMPEKAMMSKKEYRRILWTERIIFYIGTANMVWCGFLLLGKLLGNIEWW